MSICITIVQTHVNKKVLMLIANVHCERLLFTTSIIRLSTRLYGRQCPRSSFHCHETDSPRHCTTPLRTQPSTANIPSVGSLGSSSLQQQFTASKQLHPASQLPHVLPSTTFLTTGGTEQAFYGPDVLPVTDQQCQSTEGNTKQWCGLILCSPTNRLVSQGVLLPLH